MVSAITALTGLVVALTGLLRAWNQRKMRD